MGTRPHRPALVPRLARFFEKRGYFDYLRLIKKAFAGCDASGSAPCKDEVYTKKQSFNSFAFRKSKGRITVTLT